MQNHFISNTLHHQTLLNIINMSPDKGFKFQTQEKGLATYRVETTTPYEDLQIILGEVAAKVQLVLISEYQGAAKDLGSNTVALKIRQSERGRPQDGGVFHDLSIEVGYPGFEDNPSPLAIKWAARIRDAIVEVMKAFGMEGQILNIQLHAPKPQELDEKIEIDLETIQKEELDELVKKFKPGETILYWHRVEGERLKWVHCIFMGYDNFYGRIIVKQISDQWRGEYRLSLGTHDKLKTKL